MAFELPVVDAASLAGWCELHLGSSVESELLRTGHLTRVIGTRLADGREVVVREDRDQAVIGHGDWMTERCWAAGVWTRAYDAKQQHAARQPATCLTQDEAHERLRRAGMR